MSLESTRIAVPAMRSMMRALFATTAMATAAIAAVVPSARAETPIADAVYRNGYIYTVDAADSVQQAIAVQGGRIIYVGGNDGAEAFIGAGTTTIDLGGRMLMPGLVDGHTHPMEGGTLLLGCNLNFEPLTVEQFQQRIQACLDADTKSSPDSWMVVVGWLRQAMLPKGTNPGAEALDALKTERPIMVQSSDYHQVLVSTRTMKLAGITDQTANLPGGNIVRDAAGKATGVFEDHAVSLITAVQPPAKPEDDVLKFEAFQQAMAGQGVTSFLNALSEEPHLVGFATIEAKGGLTARPFFAPFVSAELTEKPDEAIAAIKDQVARYDRGKLQPKPAVAVRHAKITLDGVLEGPAHTAGILEPYWENKGTDDKPDYQPGEKNGKVYWEQDALNRMLAAFAAAGLNPHLHAIGDRAVRTALNGIEYMRQQPGGADVRPGIAHDELVDPADYPRFKSLGAIPVLSVQWAQPGSDPMRGALGFLGPKRFAYYEPSGSLEAAGARVAFGSDWPVDPLNFWNFLRIGIMRTNDSGKRLNDQPGLSRASVLRAATMNAAYELAADDDIGSLETGKLADFIVLDKNFLEIPEKDIATIHVLRTVVGGETVFDTGALH